MLGVRETVKGRWAMDASEAVELRLERREEKKENVIYDETIDIQRDHPPSSPTATRKLGMESLRALSRIIVVTGVVVLLLLNVLLSGQHVCLCGVASLDLSVHSGFMGRRRGAADRRMRAQ